MRFPTHTAAVLVGLMTTLGSAEALHANGREGVIILNNGSNATWTLKVLKTVPGYRMSIYQLPAEPGAAGPARTRLYADAPAAPGSADAPAAEPPLAPAAAAPAAPAVPDGPARVTNVPAGAVPLAKREKAGAHSGTFDYFEIPAGMMCFMQILQPVNSDTFNFPFTLGDSNGVYAVLRAQGLPFNARGSGGYGVAVEHSHYDYRDPKRMLPKDFVDDTVLVRRIVDHDELRYHGVFINITKDNYVTEPLPGK
jgi:hypothetical protein